MTPPPEQAYDERFREMTAQYQAMSMSAPEDPPTPAEVDDILNPTPETRERWAEEDAERKRKERLQSKCSKYHPTDSGNGERFTARYSDTVRYCLVRKTWYLYTGKQWLDDRTNLVRQLAKEAARSMHLEVYSILDDDVARRKLADWAARSENEQRINAMLNMASSEPKIAVLPEAFDSDGNLFNCLNGTLNLTTLELQPHRREDLLTKMAGTEYHKEAECPKWLDHLDLVFGGARARIDLARAEEAAAEAEIREAGKRLKAAEAMVSAFQMRCGYYLLAGNPHQILDIWHGDGENGKSVTLLTLRYVFGSYAYHAAADTFMDTKHDLVQPRPDLIALRDARLVTAAESEKRRHLAEALIKSMTGGEPLKVRNLYGGPEEFPPLYSPILATNNDPIIRGVEHAIWRRIKKWPFIETIPDDRKIPYYERELAAEAPGILAWAVEGLRRYYENGSKLEEPDPVKESTAAYRASMDVLRPFVVERCVIEATARTDRTELFAAYGTWCNDNKEERMTGAEFYESLRDHGWRPKTIRGRRYFEGIRLKNPKEQKEFDEATEGPDNSYQGNLNGVQGAGGCLHPD